MVLPALAAGPVVAFQTSAGNLGTGGAGVVLRTIDAGTNELVSCKNKNCATPVGVANLVPLKSSCFHAGFDDRLWPKRVITFWKPAA